MITFKQFLVEYNAPPALNVMKTDAIFSAISGEGGGPDVTVMNPKGAAFNSKTTSTLGMGFEMAPNLTGQLQKFVDKYSNKNTNSGNKATDPKTPVTWQTTNQAVSNQQKEVLDKLLVKYNLKSDTPTPSPDQIEYEEYQRWLDTQMQEWEKANPAPVRTDDMSEEEWESLWQAWLFEREIYEDGREQWYMHNTGPYARPPFPDPKPKPKPTWSPRPEWVPEPFEPNPNWWHMGPDQSDDGFAGMNNVQSPQKALLNKNNVKQDPNVFGPPAPVEEPEIFGPPATHEHLFPYHPHDHRWYDNWWKQSLEDLFRRQYLRNFGEKGLEDALRRMRETLYEQWKKWLHQGGENWSPDWQMMGRIIRTLNGYFEREDEIYA